MKIKFFPIIFLICFISSCHQKSKDEIFQQGIEYFDEGNYTSAINCFKEVLIKDTDFKNARLQLGIAYQRINKFDKAEDELEKVLILNPGDLIASIHLAEILIATERPNKAVILLNGLQKNNYENPEFLFVFAKAQNMTGNIRLSEDLFRKTLTLRPKYVKAQLGLSELLLIDGKIKEGRQLVNDVIENHPKEIDAYYLLMRQSLREWDLKSAIDYLKKIISLDKKDFLASYILGLFSIEVGDMKSAHQISNYYIKSKNNLNIGYLLEGIALYQENDFINASESLQKSLIQQPDLAGYYFLGLCKYKLELYEQAITCFQDALDISPEHNQSRLMLSQALLKQGRNIDCIRQIKIVISNDNSNAYANNILSAAYLEEKKYDLAAEQIENAVRINPEITQQKTNKNLFKKSFGYTIKRNNELYNLINTIPETINNSLLIALSYIKKNNFKMALNILENDLINSKYKSFIYYYIAMAYFGLNNNEEAVQNLVKAKTITPDFFTPYQTQASYYINHQDYQAAMAEYQSILKIDPNHMTALLKLASINELLGQNDLSQIFYERAASTRTSQGYFHLGAFQQRNGQIKEALNNFKNGYLIDRENIDLAITYAEALKTVGRVDEAIIIYIDLEGDKSGIGISHLLETYLQTRNFVAANELADKVLTENPNSPLGYILKSNIYEFSLEWQPAENILQQGFTFVENCFELKIALAQLYTKIGAYNDAQDIYENILNNMPDLIPVMFAKALVYDLAGDIKQALSLYRNILIHDEKHIPTINKLACLLMDEYGDIKNALDLASKGFLLSQSSPEILDTLGYAFLKNDQPNMAVYFLKKAARLRPDDILIKNHLLKAYSAVTRDNQRA